MKPDDKYELLTGQDAFDLLAEHGRLEADLIGRKFCIAIGALCIAALLMLAAMIVSDMAHASDPCDPADWIFANGFEVYTP